ncbi:MAG TPA: RdgB/HAM1 family non-canonical purine NTP pyrophosphatase [Thioalkalivibrio sp.]|nr:RdgB/HAM1 family non-canonical purine NTP pyrophosphatase [Thioalkalivibrio sp.]
MKVVLATGNKGKLAELRHMLEGSAFQVLPQSDFGVPEAEETGLSFVENAILKARHAAAHTGLPAIADDSGIEVEALNGAPGIYSARYAGRHGDSRANNDKLLAALAGLPEGERGARFYCVMVFLRHAEDPTPVIAEGAWTGRILEAPRGEGGFGYDPLFFDPALGRSAAELDPAEKNRISHRARALAQLRARLVSDQ